MTEPYRGYNFVIEVDGMARARFRECSGLRNSQEGGEHRGRLSGLGDGTSVTFSGGVTKDPELLEWWVKAMRGEIERHDIAISMQDDKGDSRITWKLTQCWPREWSGPSAAAASTDILIEKLVVTYERMELEE